MQKFYEILRYAIVGLLSTLFNLILLYLFSMHGMHYIMANVLSYFAAIMVSYGLNEKYVFENQKQQNKIAKIIKFLLIRVGSIGLDSLLLYGAVSIGGYALMPSKVLISMFIILLTYVCNRIYVFR